MRIFQGKAQAATELAVFGAILIFVIGGILRSSFDAGMNQNQNLKAMRWTLLQSLYGVRNENKSRDSASVLYIEDRLSPGSGKFGSLERVPLIESGSGTFSNTLLMPLDWFELHNLPVTDVFVNGQHFVFTTARFIVYQIKLIGEQIEIWDLTNNVKKNIPKQSNWVDVCTSNKIIDLASGTDLTFEYPCQLFYTLVPINSSKFCVDQSDCPDQNLTIDERYDLNRNGIFVDDPGILERDSMMWQWRAVKGFYGNASLEINKRDGVYPSYDIDGDRKEEIVFAINENLPNPLLGPISADLLHPDVVTGGIPAITSQNVVIGTTNQEVMTLTAERLFVVDSQKGDLDMTNDDFDRIGIGTTANLRVGLQQDVSIYTQTKEGTYLEIKQGKAFVPETGEFVRSVNKKDQIDVISRMFQLSNDTGRYCDPQTGFPLPKIGKDPKGLPNPVEQCVNSQQGTNCFMDGLTVSRTCFDQATKMLYIRSRIEDKRGRKWVTQTGD